MKYENAQNILPEHIIELIQEYMEGGYLYIPIKHKNKKVWGENTSTKDTLKRRNREILIDIIVEYLLKTCKRVLSY